MTTTMYASFYITNRKAKFYDIRTMAYSKTQVRENCQSEISHMNEDVQARIMKDLNIEKVIVMVEPFKK